MAWPERRVALGYAFVKDPRLRPTAVRLVQSGSRSEAPVRIPRRACLVADAAPLGSETLATTVVMWVRARHFVLAAN